MKVVVGVIFILLKFIIYKVLKIKELRGTDREGKFRERLGQREY